MRRVGNGRNASKHQEDRIESQEDLIDLCKAVGERTVGNPTRTDRQKDHDVREVGRPSSHELMNWEPGGRKARSTTSRAWQLPERRRGELRFGPW